jgi:hypothetical protein
LSTLTEHRRPQESQPGATVHVTFVSLQPIAKPFDGPVAEAIDQLGSHSRLVSLQAFGESDARYREHSPASLSKSSSPSCGSGKPSLRPVLRPRRSQDATSQAEPNGFSAWVSAWQAEQSPRMKGFSSTVLEATQGWPHRTRRRKLRERVFHAIHAHSPNRRKNRFSPGIPNAARKYSPQTPGPFWGGGATARLGAIPSRKRTLHMKDEGSQLRSLAGF